MRLIIRLHSSRKMGVDRKNVATTWIQNWGWGLVFYGAKKRVERLFRSKREAQLFLDAELRERKNYGILGSDLTQAQRLDTAEAFKLSDCMVSLVEVSRFWLSGHGVRVREHSLKKAALEWGPRTQKCLVLCLNWSLLKRVICRSGFGVLRRSAGFGRRRAGV